MNKRMLFFVLPTVMVGIGWFVLPTDSARLQPDRRVIEVREVDNGYIVQYRTSNNPYPVKEAVAKDSVEAAWQVQQYLKQAIPEPRWGK